MVAHCGAGGASDCRARLAGGHERFPCGRWRGLRPGSDDFDLVPVGQLRDKRCDLAIDLAAYCHVADIRVHRVRKVDGICAARKRNQLAFRREAKHLIVEQFELCVLEKLLGVGTLHEQLDGAAQPRIGARFTREHLSR